MQCLAEFGIYHDLEMKAAVSSKSLSVGGYIVETLGAMMHDFVQWVFTEKQAMKQARERQKVLELAQQERRNSLTMPPHAPSQSSLLQKRTKGA